MNIVENADSGHWSLWSFTVVASVLTLITLVLAIFRLELAVGSPMRSYLQRTFTRTKEDEEGGWAGRTS